MFCEKCGGLMLPRDKKLVCTKCKGERIISSGEEYKLTSSSKKRPTLLILEDTVRTLPTTQAECPRCKHMEAEWWLLQTRKADEAETRFFRCTKCKFTWREYN